MPDSALQKGSIRPPSTRSGADARFFLSRCRSLQAQQSNPSLSASSEPNGAIGSTMPIANATQPQGSRNFVPQEPHNAILLYQPQTSAFEQRGFLSAGANNADKYELSKNCRPSPSHGSDHIACDETSCDSSRPSPPNADETRSSQELPPSPAASRNDQEGETLFLGTHHQPEVAEQNLSIYALVSSKDLKIKSNPTNSTTIIGTHQERGLFRPCYFRQKRVYIYAECGVLQDPHSARFSPEINFSVARTKPRPRLRTRFTFFSIPGRFPSTGQANFSISHCVELTPAGEMKHNLRPTTFDNATGNTWTGFAGRTFDTLRSLAHCGHRKRIHDSYRSSSGFHGVVQRSPIAPTLAARATRRHR